MAREELRACLRQAISNKPNSTGDNGGNREFHFCVSVFSVNSCSKNPRAPQPTLTGFAHSSFAPFNPQQIGMHPGRTLC